jgi:signal transduction histidine kinase
VQRAVTETQLLTRQHAVRLAAPPTPVIGDWDADRLDQVMQNLLSNAVKYSPNGGEILVRVEQLPGGARFAVTDQGVGIAPEAIPQLFSRFYRSREAAASGIGGLGLGLAIAHLLVAAHGGQITVTSRPGAGSTFQVDLPSAAPAPPAAPTAEPAAAPAAAPATAARHGEDGEDAWTG